MSRAFTVACVLWCAVALAGPHAAARAPPELRVSAVEAVTHNRYEPYVVVGRAREGRGFVTYSFTLQ